MDVPVRCHKSYELVMFGEVRSFPEWVKEPPTGQLKGGTDDQSVGQALANRLKKGLVH